MKYRAKTSFSPGTYINGNYFVHGDSFGTRYKIALRLGEEFKPLFPDSIDLKITNACRWGCPFCHESSVPGGKSYDFERTTAFLGDLPKVGIEVAMGGGSLLEDLESTDRLYRWLKENSFLPRITLSYHDYEANQDTLKAASEWAIDKEDHERKKLAEYLTEVTRGVSIYKYEEDPLPEKYIFFLSHPVVYHVIIGVLPAQDFLKMYEDKRKYERILILGFKSFGRALGQEPGELEEWRDIISHIVKRNKVYLEKGDKVLGFDNLAIEQLGLGELLEPGEWELYYQGNEFTSSMYVDAVEETVAPTSRTPYQERVPWSKCGGILKYYEQNHKV